MPYGSGSLDPFFFWPNLPRPETCGCRDDFLDVEDTAVDCDDDAIDEALLELTATGGGPPPPEAAADDDDDDDEYDVAAALLLPT